MTFAYRLLIRCITPLVFIYLWVRSRKAPAYRQRWPERLALQDVPVQARDGINIHCVSVGETVAAKGLIEQILNDYPHLGVTLTSMTPTAAELAVKLFGDRVFHAYLPIDTPGSMRRFFDKFAPRLVVILETELWPCMLQQAQQRAVPVMVVNARLSERSAKSYRKYSWLVGPIWPAVTAIAAQTQATRTHFIELGMSSERVVVRGNLKHDFQVSHEIKAEAERLREQLNRPILLAASTHDGEDEQVLSAFRKLQKHHPSALLILVPRHPERFEAVAEAIAKAGFTYVRRSSGEEIASQSQVFLGDSMGELLLWYALADVAFVGGSLIERGGHNPLEPVATQTPVISGRHIFNFQDIYDRLQQANGVMMVSSAEELASSWHQLLEQPALCKQLANNAANEFANDQGATSAVFSDIREMLSAGTGAATSRTVFMMQTVNPARGTTLWFDPEVLSDCKNEYFDPDYWRARNEIKGSATGRSTAWFIKAGEHGLLLRHYYRGGLVGKVNTDRFKREPVVNSRAMAEFSLLLKLREAGLPVPRPVAARYVKAPIWGYRADILVEVIPDAQDTFKLLQQRQLEDNEWDSLGQVIKQLHNHQVYHSDLNCHNLMLDNAGKAWIVDFDKCEIRAEGDWREKNIQRLLRSFRKELTKATEANQVFHWDETRDWPKLIAGYSRI